MKKHDKWYMTDDEIRRSWRCCRDKIEQVKVLAELNCKTKEEIIEKLESLGLDVPVRISGRGIKTKMTETIRKKIWKLKMEGKSYSQITALVEGRLSVECVRTEYMKMIGEHEKARPLLIKALQAYTQRDDCTDEEREIIMKHIARGI